VSLRASVFLIVVCVMGLASQANEPQNGASAIRIAAMDLPEKPVIVAVTYVSKNGVRLEVVFNNDRDCVTVTLPGRKIVMERALAASGVKYARGNESFWEHQGKGRYLVGETVIFEGTIERQRELHGPDI
jgi:membrane-bound inhibitor of C-type lysozyme